MNNKGFTLIELVAIILVLVAIFLVSFPSLLNISKTDEEKEYKTMVEDLCLAGKSYIYANTSLFSELSVIGGNIEIPIETLIEYGNVKSDMVNPKTNKKVEKDSLNFTVLSDYSLNCEYKEV